MTAKKKKKFIFFPITMSLSFLTLDFKKIMLLMISISRCKSSNVTFDASYLSFSVFRQNIFVSSSLTETFMYQINLFMFANRFFYKTDLVRKEFTRTAGNAHASFWMK
jgi:hypothetical protein